MQIHQALSLRHTTLVRKFCEHRNHIYFAPLYIPSLKKYSKINMHSTNTCDINVATEIFKQKYVPDPLKQENFCP